MTFFQRNRDSLSAIGIDPNRLPPGQYHTKRFPVLQAGSVPRVALTDWDFTIDGLVENPVRLSWDDISAMPQTTMTADIHCVTKWSKFDTRWEGVSVDDLMDLVKPLPEAHHVMVNAYHGFTANLPLVDFVADNNVFAHTYEGVRLDPDHGYPLRLVVPHLYFWKSVKWVRGFTLIADEEPGFWERAGYHMYGDPFREQRYRGD
jgi:DMSO/TMAO reductase YedYZ molybdopterin-dependent catalytic subunit